MAAAAGGSVGAGRLVRSNVVCACGKTLCERLSPASPRDCQSRGRYRHYCERCSYYVWRLLSEHGRKAFEDPRTGALRPVEKRDVLVLQHVSADTGALLPGEVEIILWADPSLRVRDGDRGGVRLEPAHLSRALAARDQGRETAAGRSTTP